MTDSSCSACASGICSNGTHREFRKLEAERDELAAIVQDLAACDPMVYNVEIECMSPGCSLSCEYVQDQEALLVGDHSESCLWRRARVWQEQQNHTNNSPQQETPNQ